MNRYQIEENLGDHIFYQTQRGKNIETDESVILRQHKKKFYSWQDILNLREVKITKYLNHPNLIRLKEIIKTKEKLTCVYEDQEQSIYDWYINLRDENKTLTENSIKNIMYQIVQGIQYLHNKGFFHRDLCPENIFINENQTIKIGQFTSAREMNIKPPLSDYITTRWYRAPEQLLLSTNYNYKVDIWALGCMFAELYMLGPIFGGQTEVDQLNRILQILGTPGLKDWPEFFVHAHNLDIKFPEKQKNEKCKLAQLLPTASPEAIDLMQKILTYNPVKRITCTAILKHPFFTGGNLLNQSSPKQSIMQLDMIQGTDAGKKDIKQVELSVNTGKNTLRNETIDEVPDNISNQGDISKMEQDDGNEKNDKKVNFEQTLLKNITNK